MEMLRHSHRGLGYLVLGLIIVVLIWSISLATRDQEPGKAAKITGSATVGLLDLQALIGIVYLFMIPTTTTKMLLEHPVPIILGIIAFHVGNRQTHWSRVIWFLSGVVLILGGAYPMLKRLL